MESVLYVYLLVLLESKNNAWRARVSVACCCRCCLLAPCFGCTTDASATPTTQRVRRMYTIFTRFRVFRFSSCFFSSQGSQRFDTSRKMRPPAWTDRILYSPSAPHAVSPVKYTSVPDSFHSDHRPVYAKFRVQLAD